MSLAGEWRLREIVVAEVRRALRAELGILRQEAMNADDVAEFLGVDRKTVYDYANRGAIPHQKLGRRLLFSRQALMAWLGTCNSRRASR